MRTIVIRNNTSEDKIWLRTFLAGESYTLPSDNSLAFKYSSLDSILTAIANGDASIGDGTTFFSTINEQINWLKNEDNTPKDSDGSILSRIKITKSGWTYQSLNFEIQTATNSNGVYCKDEDGNSLSYFTYIMKDSNGATTTTNADAVKTIVDLELPYDFELIKGAVRQKERPATDIYYHCIIVPDISYANGGSRALVRCVDLSFISPDERIELDGKSPKLLTYNTTYHTNKIRFVINHNQGVQHKFLQSLDYYRA